MGRKHSPKGTIVLGKNEKLEAAHAAITGTVTHEALAEKFKEMYPDDWKRIAARYNKHERNTPRGKGHPMPNPETYLKNMAKVFLGKK